MKENKRNCMVFEAPEELSNKAKEYASAQFTSTSAVCRQALNEFLQQNQLFNEEPDIPSY